MSATKGESAKSNYSTAAHSKMHRSRARKCPKSFQCDDCGLSVTRREHLKKHKLRKHPGAASSRFPCLRCPKVFTFAQDLTRHEKNHVLDKLHSCPCGRNFKSKEDLSVHTKKMHTGCEMLTCKICGLKLKTPQLRSVHHRLVHEKRLFHCSQCDASYRYKISVLRHETMEHSDEMPYQCNQCEQKFKILSVLKIHQRKRCRGKPVKKKIYSEKKMRQGSDNCSEENIKFIDDTSSKTQLCEIVNAQDCAPQKDLIDSEELDNSISASGDYVSDESKLDAAEPIQEQNPHETAVEINLTETPERDVLCFLHHQELSHKEEEKCESLEKKEEFSTVDVSSMRKMLRDEEEISSTSKEKTSLRNNKVIQDLGLEKDLENDDDSSTCNYMYDDNAKCDATTFSGDKVDSDTDNNECKELSAVADMCSTATAIVLGPSVHSENSSDETMKDKASGTLLLAKEDFEVEGEELCNTDTPSENNLKVSPATKAEIEENTSENNLKVSPATKAEIEENTSENNLKVSPATKAEIEENTSCVTDINQGDISGSSIKTDASSVKMKVNTDEEETCHVKEEPHEKVNSVKCFEEENPSHSDGKDNVILINGYQCNECDAILSSKDSLRRHKIRKHPSEDSYRFQCPRCPKSFNFDRDLRQHLKNHVPDKPHKCLCSQGFVTKEDLAEHTKKMHTGRNLKKCKLCGLKVKSASLLSVHHNIVHEKRTFQCPQCDRSFKYKLGLERHQKTLHSDKMPFQCEQCEQQFKLIEALKRHKKMCQGEPVIDNKGKAFQYVATSSPKYLCKFCGKVCKTKSNLSYHEITHTGDRPYQCEHCEKAFTRREILKQHIRIHTGEKPYVCSICGKAFRQVMALTKHTKTHKKREPIPCKICGKGFQQMAYVKDHVNRMHKEEKELAQYSLSILKQFKK